MSVLRLEGKLEPFDDYGYDGGNEFWAGRTWSVGSAELEDALRQFEGRVVRVTIETVEP